MTDLVNENEQWETIKAWLKENGVFLIIVIVLSIASTTGWRYWQQHQVAKRSEASQLFDQLLAVQANDTNHTTARVASEIQAKYTSTPYASASAWIEAKAAVASGNLSLAEQKLQWALDHARNPAMRDMSRVRLARILLAENKPDAALAVLAKAENAGYAAAIEQVKGDIYLAQKQTNKARQAYQAALQAFPANEPLRAYVEMQLNQLPAE